jgi:hypothetical protein
MDESADRRGLGQAARFPGVDHGVIVAHALVDGGRLGGVVEGLGGVGHEGLALGLDVDGGCTSSASIMAPMMPSTKGANCLSRMPALWAAVRTMSNTGSLASSAA